MIERGDLFDASERANTLLAEVLDELRMARRGRDEFFRDRPIRRSSVLDPARGSLGGLAEEAYRCYGQATGNKNFRGEPMPDYASLPDNIRSAWEAAAEGIVLMIGRE